MKRPLTLSYARLFMDLDKSTQEISVQDRLDSTEKTHFMVLEYHYERPTDCCGYEGLGRIPKTYLPSEQVFALDAIDTQQWSCPLEGPASIFERHPLFDYAQEATRRHTPFQPMVKAVEELVVSHYRKNLLKHIREHVVLSEPTVRTKYRR